MEDLCIKCPAKINLSLDVIGKREDGYHLLKMIMQSVALYDVVRLKRNQGGINIIINGPKDIPCDNRNTAYKAADIMIKKYKIEGGMDIFIEKNIPAGAGLAGGSTDAAGVIYGINELMHLNLNIDDMMDIGVKVGADVPFCILKGIALAEGIGNILTPLKSLPETWCIIAKPPVSVSTKEVYTRLKLDEISRHPNTESLIRYIEDGNVEAVGGNMINVLETVTIKEHPIIFEIKKIMMEFQAIGSMMSGSGPSVFGLFRNKEEAEMCFNRLKDYLKEVYIVTTEVGENKV